MSVDKILGALNKQQLEAVKHVHGSTLVVAGAGSGKTRVITHRIGYLIEACDVKPWKILAVTFTNKAASAIKNRLATMIGENANRVWAGTFHSTAAKILRKHGDAIDINRDFTIFDDSDQMVLINECISELRLPDKKYHPRTVLSKISTAKEQLITPEEFPEVFNVEKTDTGVGRVYTLYQKKLKENSGLDFDDLIFNAVTLLRKRPDVLEYYHDHFHHILVDEFQDINLSQYTLVKLLAAGHNNICCVGDDDQSIYSWRGADVGLILRFEQDYPNTKIIKLEQNYRSTKTILEAAHEVVSQNKARRDKKLWTENLEGQAIEIFEAANEHDEAIHVANVILDRVAAESRRYSDFVVLYRTNAQSRVLEEAFMNYRVPYQLIGALRFYERKEIKDALAYLRLASNPYESISLKRVINVPPRGVGPGTMEKIDLYAETRGKFLWDALRSIDLIPDISRKAEREIKAFVQLIEHLHERREDYPVQRLVQDALENSGYLLHIRSDKSMDAQSRMENLKEFVSVAEEFDKSSEDRSVRAFLEQVALIADIDTYEESGNSVTLMTLHAAKGLEYPIVFIVGMEEGIFPHLRSIGEPAELEEERRLCYVGMTRAMEELHFVHARLRSFVGETKRRDRSRFLREVPRQLLTSRAVSTPSATTTWKRPVRPTRSVPASTFRPGERVHHQKFGQGIVLNSTGVDDEEQVTVAFDGHGLKKLLLCYAKLERVKR